MTDGLVTDNLFMRRALELAKQGWGSVAPNPLVGAVIARGDQVIAEGVHTERGAGHAEVEAIGKATGSLEEATLYVNLEPCAHSGLTPPCAEAIIRAGIQHVVIGCRDPNPEATGGVERLRAANVEVRLGVEREAAIRLNAPFLWSHMQAQPFVALKLALSLDGHIAAAPGVRTALTGPEAGEEVHRLRAGFDAILVGSHTADVDDPLLTARGESPPRTPSLRVVLDGDLSLRPDSRLATSVADAPVWVMTSDSADEERRDALREVGVRTVNAALAPDGKLDLNDVMARLFDGGVRSVLCEGGGLLASSLLAAGRVQRLYLFIVPRFLGRSGVRGIDLEGSAGSWIPVEPKAFGRDILVEFDESRFMDRLRSAA